MSELIQKNDNRATIRWKLLTTVSAVALTAYVSSAGVARADDSDRPTLWIEFGGQMETVQGLSAPFTAPFMFLTPVPDAYQGVSITGFQRQSRFAFGADGKISFQPENSDWIFSAGIRYGRSNANRHVHHQTSGILVYDKYYYGTLANPRHLQTAEAFLDATVHTKEHHEILDFTAGHDVGIGLLGRDGTSTISAGVRVVDLAAGLSGTVYARPHVGFQYQPPKYAFAKAVFTQYTLTGSAVRSFKGVGPSLSWNASAGLAGNKEDGEIMLDWGVNAALLFGRQKAKVHHYTLATYYNGAEVYVPNTHFYQGPVYPTRNVHVTRSKRVTVPNIGGFAGLSVKYPNVKVSVGYRIDSFFHAMDTGIDTAKKSNLSFNGPYASISIGVGD